MMEDSEAGGSDSGGICSRLHLWVDLRWNMATAGSKAHTMRFMPARPVVPAYRIILEWLVS